MSKTLILQSHRTPMPHAWLSRCINTVEQWSDTNNFDYVFKDNEFLSIVPADILDKTNKQVVIATDLARLLWIKYFLNNSYERVVWLDADFLIFEPDKFLLPDKPYALGREVWVQRNEQQLKVYKKVHNAFLMFNENNCFLDFYIETAKNLLWLNEGAMPPQFIGPKLLTAIHNIAQCPVLEFAGMLSPLVIKDLLQGKGKALDLFLRKSKQEIYGVNLSSSLTQKESLNEIEMNKLIDLLLEGNILKMI